MQLARVGYGWVNSDGTPWLLLKQYIMRRVQGQARLRARRVWATPL